MGRHGLRSASKRRGMLGNVCGRTLRAGVDDRVLGKALQMTNKTFTREKDAEPQSFMHEFAPEFARKRDQAWLHQRITSLELEGKRGRGSTYNRSAAGDLLRDKQAILQRLKGWFECFFTQYRLRPIPL